MERKEVKTIFKNGKYFTMIPNVFIKDVDGEECLLNEKQLSIALIISNGPAPSIQIQGRFSGLNTRGSNAVHFPEWEHWERSQYTIKSSVLYSLNCLFSSITLVPRSCFVYSISLILPYFISYGN